MYEENEWKKRRIFVGSDAAINKSSVSTLSAGVVAAAAADVWSTEMYTAMNLGEQTTQPSSSVRHSSTRRERYGPGLESSDHQFCN